MTGLIDELREVAHIREFAAKYRASQRYNYKVKSREIHKVDMVLKKVVILSQQGKLQPKSEEPYRIYQKSLTEHISCKSLKDNFNVGLGMYSISNIIIVTIIL